jgi:hypothetical protein
MNALQIAFQNLTALSSQVLGLPFLSQKLFALFFLLIFARSRKSAMRSISILTDRPQ